MVSDTQDLSVVKPRPQVDPPQALAPLPQLQGSVEVGDGSDHLG